ncbi:MAG: Thymidylate kinase [Paramarteilia canceri]
MSDRAIHLLFSANRHELANQITDNLKDGKTVIIDRYAFSGVAYSSAKGLAIEWCKNPDAHLPKPDLVIFFDKTPISAEKMNGYGDER